MPDKARVAVFMGGRSGEHEVSLNSGKGVVAALEKGGRFSPLPVVIGRDGAWSVDGGPPAPAAGAVGALVGLAPACAFIALHGPYGEDGRMQGLLDMVGIPYTGSGCAASALAMDKIRGKAVVEMAGVPVAGQVTFTRAAWETGAEAISRSTGAALGFPCVVKTAALGSSVGVEIVQAPGDFASVVNRIVEWGEEILVEEFIPGIELTASVLDVDLGGPCRALPLTEIRPKTSTFFDYEAKYQPGATDEITPADLDPLLTKEIQDMATQAHAAIGCKGWSRSDFMLGDDGPIWIEINTVPGLTQTSLYPQACAAAGISYMEMVHLFIDAALADAGC